MDINIIEIYKSANSKLEVIDRLARETGKTIPEIFVELSEAKCCDGRFFRQGRYAKEWNEAKKIMKENNLKRAAEATKSFSDLKAENERLRKQMKVSVSEEEFEKLKEELEKCQQSSQFVAIDSEVPESYQQTIDMQQKEIGRLKEEIDVLNTENVSLEENIEALKSMLENAKSSGLDSEAVKQMQEENEAADRVIEQLRGEIEQLKTANAAAHDAFAKLDDEKSDSDALIEDFRNVIALREDEIKELNEKIKHLKVSDFNATADGMVLESKLKTAEDKNAKLLERIRGLEEENEELRCTNCADDIKKQLDLLEEEKESDGAIIVDQAKRIASLEKKLAKAEAYVLNRVLYEVEA